MKRINITINLPLHVRLKSIKHETGVSVSELIRRAAEAMYGDDSPPPVKKKPKPRRPKP